MECGLWSGQRKTSFVAGVQFPRMEASKTQKKQSQGQVQTPVSFVCQLGWGVGGAFEQIPFRISEVILFVDTFLNFIDLIMTGQHGSWQRCLKPFPVYDAIYNLLCPSHNYKGPTDFCGLLVCLRGGEGGSNGPSLLGPHQVILSFSRGSLMAYGTQSSQSVHINPHLDQGLPKFCHQGYCLVAYIFLTLILFNTLYSFLHPVKKKLSASNKCQALLTLGIQ